MIIASTRCQSIGSFLVSVERCSPQPIAGWTSEGIPPFQGGSPPIDVCIRQIPACHGVCGLLKVLLFSFVLFDLCRKSNLEIIQPQDYSFGFATIENLRRDVLNNIICNKNEASIPLRLFRQQIHTMTSMC